MKKDTLTLTKALRLDHIPPPRVAFVGAGGKTTALFQAARELAPCIVTTTTHLGAWQAKEANQHIIIRKMKDVNQLEEIAFSGVILVTGAKEKNRLKALKLEELHWLEQFCNYHSLPLLIEADGARGKALKAPKAHEPVIPEFVKTVVVVAGLSGVGKCLDDENIYNAERFEKLSRKWKAGSEKPEEKTVSAKMLANVFMHNDGGLKNIPPHARKVALLNQADTPELQAIGGKIAKKLLFPRSDDFSRQGLRTEVLTTRGVDATIVASLQPVTWNLALETSPIQTFERLAAIILAAGSSSRFGAPKQLLDYHGKAFIRVVAETALQAELDPIVVVTGAEHDKISAVLADLPVKIVHNPNWADGQSLSIHVGVENLEPNTGSALFLLADQPQVTPTVIRALTEEHARTLHPVIAPMVEDRRANPVLFDRVTFKALTELKGDIGGRGIFSKFPPKYIHWNDSGLLLDVDTPEAYKKLIER